MSMMAGLMGGEDSADYKPAKAPKPPERDDAKIDKHTMKAYKNLAKKDSYTQNIIGGSAAAPVQSYSAQLFSANPSGM